MMSLPDILQPLANPSASLGAVLSVCLLAGFIASAICPCTIPVGLGVAGVAGASETMARRSGLAIAGAFFAGIVFCLTVLGALAGQIGALATESFGRNWALGMSIVSLLAAILAFWGPRMKDQTLLALRHPRPIGVFGYGLVFSLGTSVAPLLLLLTVSAAVKQPVYGVLLAFVFGVGRGLPFFIVGATASGVMQLARLGVWSRAMQIASGAALLLVSIYYAQVFTSLL